MYYPVPLLFMDCAILYGSFYLWHYVRDCVGRGGVETETTFVGSSHQGTAY